MKKRVMMFVCGTILPVSQGSDRLIYEIARHLHAQDDVELSIVVLGGDSKAMREGIGDLCSHVIWWDWPRRWGIAGILNKIVSRLGIVMLTCFANALSLRRSFAEISTDQDVLILNYAMWFPLVPRSVRTEKAIVITHDVMWYRLKSFMRNPGWLSAVKVWLNRLVEKQVLLSFWRTAVLADYERDLLSSAGLPLDKIIKIGAPMRAPKSVFDRQGPFKYDFMILGGNSYQNEAVVKAFFSRLVPLLGGRHVSLAVVGGICTSSVWLGLDVPNSVDVFRLGYVENVSAVCQNVRIGVGTVPYGSGIKMKVVEMIVNVLPVVVTRHGIEGIPFLPEGCINIDEEGSAASARRLGDWLDDPNLAVVGGKAMAQLVGKVFAPANTLGSLLMTIRGA